MCAFRGKKKKQNHLEPSPQRPIQLYCPRRDARARAREVETASAISRCSIFLHVACNRPAILYLQHCYRDAVAPIPRDLSAYIYRRGKNSAGRAGRGSGRITAAATCRDNGNTGSKGNYYSLGLKDPTASCGGNCAPANALHFCANSLASPGILVCTRASTAPVELTGSEIFPTHVSTT